MKIKNKVDRISLAGGLLGALFTNPRKAIDDRVAEANANGWHLHQILPHQETNLFIWLVSLLLLALTLGMFTFGAGYILLFQKHEE